MVRKWIHPDDCFIERNHDDFPGRAVLFDCDGDQVFDFAAEEWTDEQIFTALALANIAYDRGYTVGQASKALEVRKALQITGCGCHG